MDHNGVGLRLSSNEQDEEEEVPLSKATQFLFEECRMLLPGIQALFGFQLAAVFSPRFGDLLTSAEKRLHLLAMGLVAVAVALIMSPAAYHRQTCPRLVTARFFRISTRLVLLSMPCLAISFCLEFYLITRIITDALAASALASALFAVFFTLWFLLPRVRTSNNASAGNRTPNLPRHPKNPERS